jgi:hypothetical protein
MGSEEEDEDKVGNLLLCCSKLLSDLDATIKFSHMLTRCMGEEGIDVSISTPLP